MKDIHKNLPLIQLNYFTWLDWIIFGILILILIWVYKEFFYFSEKKKKEDKKKKVEKFIPPKFSFKKKEEKLKKFLDEEKWKEFSLEATKILKLILEKKYQENFLFATGREMEEILEKKNISLEKKNELKEFFDILDPIKFAKMKSHREEAKKIIKILNDFYGN